MFFRVDKRSVEKLFNAVVAFYFVYLLFYDGGELELFGFSYFFLLLPVGAFVFFGLVYTVAYRKFFTYDKSTLAILLFTFFSSAISLFRFDIVGSASAALLGLTVFVILHHRVRYNVTLLNALYLLSVLLSVPMYYLGINTYGFVPGMNSIENSTELLAGRVSIFPGVASSIQVSFLILVINIFYGPKLWKWVLIAISLYYIYFGVSRLMILSIIFFMSIFALTKMATFKGNRFYSDTLPFIIILSLAFSVLGISYLVSSLASVEFISSYFFRGLSDADDVLSDLARIEIWLSHFSIFVNHPLGISSLEHLSIASEMGYESLGSESFLTRIFVAYGISSIFFIYFVYVVIRRSVIEGDFFCYIMALSIILLGLIYGSSFNAYNVVFLILISSLVHHAKEQQ